MPLPKKCELCGNIYQCRNDKINYSRFCSRHCTNVNAGLVSRDKRHNAWRQETKKQSLLKMQKHFETYFKKSYDCWLWMPRNGKKITEYGCFTFRGKHYKSNRASWLIYRGTIPVGMYVLHKCDVRNCVNPEHLFLGTHADNMKDMGIKCRTRGNRRLNVEQVNEIRKELDRGVTTVRLAQDYNVSPTCIWHIKHNKTWRSMV
jgi:hypothetical protein